MLGGSDLDARGEPARRLAEDQPLLAACAAASVVSRPASAREPGAIVLENHTLCRRRKPGGKLVARVPSSVLGLMARWRGRLRRRNSWKSSRLWCRPRASSCQTSESEPSHGCVTCPSPTNTKCCRSSSEVTINTLGSRATRRPCRPTWRRPSGCGGNSWLELDGPIKRRNHGSGLSPCLDNFHCLLPSRCIRCCVTQRIHDLRSRMP